MFSRKVGIGLNILLIILWIVKSCTAVDKKFNGPIMKFTAVSNKFNKAYVTNYTAWITDHALNVDVDIINEFSYGLMTKFDLQIKLQGSQSYQTLIQNEFDICKLLNANFREGIFRTCFKNILKYGNFMENCPIPEGHYFLRNFIFESSCIPVYLRPGEYRIILSHRYKKEKSKTLEFFALTTMDIRYK